MNSYKPIPDADPKKWEASFDAALKSGADKIKTLPNGRRITINDGPFDLAAFHKAHDAWFISNGQLGIFAADGKLTGRGTYGILKSLDQKEPAVKAAIKLWGAQFSGDRPIDESGMLGAQTQQAQQNPAQNPESSEIELRKTLAEILDTDEAKALISYVAGGAAPEIKPVVCGGKIAFAGAVWASWKSAQGRDELLTVGVDWLFRRGSWDAVGLCFSFGYKGLKVEGKQFLLPKGIDLVKGDKTAQAIARTSQALIADAKSVLSDGLKRVRGIDGLSDVFRHNREVLAKACDIGALESLGKIRWIAVDTDSGLKLLCRARLGVQEVKNAYAVCAGANTNNLTKLTAERLDGVVSVIAARVNYATADNGSGWHAWTWLDYWSSSASASDLKALDVSMVSGTVSKGTSDDSTQVSSGIWGGGTFDRLSCRQGSLDSGD